MSARGDIQTGFLGVLRVGGQSNDEVRATVGIADPQNFQNALEGAGEAEFAAEPRDVEAGV